MTDAVVTSGLVKRYGRITAVDGVDLRIPTGDVYGILGPNGSGKTTVIRMLLGLVLPSAGDIHLLGEHTPAGRMAALHHVGAIVEGPGFYGYLSGRRNLSLFDASGGDSSRHGRADRIETVLAQVGLADIDDRPVRSYSMGMRQRLALASALLRQPALLILDEPTNGLDPQGIGELRTLLRALAETGTTICLSSHLLPEVEQLCSGMGMMAAGRLVVQGHIDDIRRPTGRVLVSTPEAVRGATVLADLPSQVEADSLTVTVDASRAADVNRRLVEAGIPVTGLVIERRTLEQAYLEATGRSGDVPS
jgi:ABC-2 type transport system ATP-binding protein